MKPALKKTITRTFKITTSPEIMNTIERFMALLHFNSIFGHSSLFGMFLDGDGNEKVTVADIPKYIAKEVETIGGVGYGVEIAHSNGYSGEFIDRNKERRWLVKDGKYYKDGIVEKILDKKDD